MISIWHWHTEPALLGGILLVAWIYLALVGPLRDWISPLTEFPRRESFWFVMAVIWFYIAVGSPLDALGENYLFSAHMLQHMVLMYPVALFTIWAIPQWLVDGLLAKSRLATGVCRILLHPVTAGVSFTFVFTIWHFPALYEAALHNKRLHMLEHLTMYLVSIQMFWPIWSRSKIIPRMHCGMHPIYIFLLMVAQLPLFAILTFATEVLYPTYELAPRVIDLEPLPDQVLGGLIMKVSNMIVSLIAIGRAFYFWYQESNALSDAELALAKARAT